MTIEQAKSLSETAISRLMDALERGQSDALKLYLAAMSRFQQQLRPAEHLQRPGHVQTLHARVHDDNDVARGVRAGHRLGSCPIAWLSARTDFPRSLPLSSISLLRPDAPTFRPGGTELFHWHASCNIGGTNVDPWLT